MQHWIIPPIAVAVFGAVCYWETRRGRFDDATILRIARSGLLFAVVAAAVMVPLTTGRVAANPASFGVAAGALFGAIMLAVALSACILARFRAVSVVRAVQPDPGHWPDNLPASAHRIAHSASALCVVAVLFELSLNLVEGRPPLEDRGTIKGTAYGVALLYSAQTVYWFARRKIVDGRSRPS